MCDFALHIETFIEYVQKIKCYVMSYVMSCYISCHLSLNMSFEFKPNYLFGFYDIRLRYRVKKSYWWVGGCFISRLSIGQSRSILSFPNH